MVLGCKADLERAIKPFDASAMLNQHDAGLIEVSNVLEVGREKMKQSFAYMLKAILRQRGSLLYLISSLYLALIPFLGPSRIDDRNPASPDLPHKEPPWEKSRANTPTTPASPLVPSPNIGLSTLLHTTIPEDPDSSAINPPTVPSSPILAQLTGDSICKLDALEPLTGSSNVLPVEPEKIQQPVSSLDTIEASLSSPEAAVEQPSDERKTELKKQL